MAKTPESELTDEEIAKRRDEGLRRLLTTPPKPHAEMVGGKKKPRGNKPVDKQKTALRQDRTDQEIIDGFEFGRPMTDEEYDLARRLVEPPKLTSAE